MYKKKISTIAVITILTLSTFLAAMPMASAINTPTLYDSFTGAPTTGGWCYSFVDVEGTGATAFGKVEVYWDSLANKLGEGYADSAGAFDIKRIVIPFDLVGPHEVIVFDVLSSGTAFATYTITSFISLSESKALPGDSIMVYGSGFGDELDVSIYLGAITAVAGESVTLGGTPVTGTLANAPIVILTGALTVNVDIDCTTVGAATGSGSVAVTDDGEGNLEGSTAGIAVTDGTNPGLVDVDITGSINYATGVITLVATGVDGGGANTATDIVVTITTPATANYYTAEYEITPAAGVTTDDEGSFTASIVVPAIPEVDYGTFAVTAIDTDNNQAQNVVMPPFWPPFVVDYYLTLTPDSGPTGITTAIEGRIKPATDYELRFNGVPIDTGTSGADGSFEGSYLIPSVLSVGTYPVDIVWEVTESRSEDFDVTAPPQVVYAPTSAVAGAVITISTVTGFPFSSNAEISLYLGSTLVNSTEMDDRFGPTVASGAAAGSFTNLEFTVPALTPGPYALKVVDEFGASTAPVYSFTVLPTPETVVELRGTTYYPMDIFSFNIQTTESDLGTITVTIRDPAGAIWWTTDDWTLTGTGTKSVIFQEQGADDYNQMRMMLPADAPLGTWNWTITYTPASTNTLTKATGLFNVVMKPSMATVIDELTVFLEDLNASIVAIDDAIASIEIPELGTITASLSSLDSKVTSISGDMATVETSLGTVQTTVESLDVVVGSLYGDVVTLQTAVGDVQTSVDNLDATVTSIEDGVVTIDTNFGTLEGTITDMEGDIATVQTDVGTLKVDVADVKSNVGSVKTTVDDSLPVTVDMMPVWIAVILSLIAAIAAIFAVITIRQKIAG